MLIIALPVSIVIFSCSLCNLISLRVLHFKLLSLVKLAPFTCTERAPPEDANSQLNGFDAILSNSNLQLNSHENSQAGQKMPISAANVQFSCIMSTYYNVIDSSGDLPLNRLK